MTPLERAARALYRTDDFDPHQFGEDKVWPDLVDYVKLVLEAIREPSEGMVSAAMDRDKLGYDPLPGEVWQAMIDAALAEG